MKKSGLIFVILFSLLIIGGVELECYENEKYYRYIEETFIENYNFVQNGVKLEYIANEGIAEEKSRIIEFIKNNITNDIEVNNSSINFCDDSLSYGINLIDIGSTKVEVTIINNSSDIKSLDLRQAVERLKNNKCIDDRIYYFSKLKINPWSVRHVHSSLYTSQIPTERSPSFQAPFFANDRICLYCSIHLI